MWRDLAYWCLWRFPHMADRPLRAYFENERWTKKLEGRSGNDLLKAWCQGLTGYPLVRALHTGYTVLILIPDTHWPYQGRDL
jgi:deoxyribodipyrimidine photo-lyase